MVPIQAIEALPLFGKLTQETVLSKSKLLKQFKSWQTWCVGSLSKIQSLWEIEEDIPVRLDTTCCWSISDEELF